MNSRLLFVSLALILTITSCALGGDNALTPSGFGYVRIGADIKRIPKSSAGLYDTIEAEMIEAYDYEGVEYHLMLGGEKIATVIEDRGRIHSIQVFSDKVQTSDGFGLQKTAAEILAAGGTAYCDNYGFEGLLFKGMLFSCMELTPSGQKKAETAYLDGTPQVFEESDFKPGTRPGRITIMKWYAQQ